MLYHGVKRTVNGCLYRVGAALLAIDDPAHCLERGDEWIFGPETPYECHGDVGNVVFPCGYTLGDDGDELRIYYGAADTCIGVAFSSVHAILNWLQTERRSSLALTSADFEADRGAGESQSTEPLRAMEWPRTLPDLDPETSGSNSRR
jgi:hypothetical protein